jgi:hypothetical protein
MRPTGVVDGQLASGYLLRHRVLGEKAVYRVLEARGQTVDVEAVAVPGLTPGTRVRLTAEVATAMRARNAHANEARQGMVFPARPLRAPRRA